MNWLSFICFAFLYSLTVIAENAIRSGFLYALLLFAVGVTTLFGLLALIRTQWRRNRPDQEEGRVGRLLALLPLPDAAAGRRKGFRIPDVPDWLLSSFWVYAGVLAGAVQMYLLSFLCLFHIKEIQNLLAYGIGKLMEKNKL